MTSKAGRPEEDGMDETEARTAATKTERVRLDSGWLFGGSVPLPGVEDRLDPDIVRAYSRADLDDSLWERVVLPHTVTPLTWKLWNPATWEKVWIYRRHFDLPVEYVGRRIFVDFDGAMTNATVTLNELSLGEHRGGYLPFGFEITDVATAEARNTLVVMLDSRFNLNVPPNIPAPAKSTSFDFWQPGGIHREVWLRAVPQTFITSIQVTHEDVLDPVKRRSSVVVHVDSAVELADAAIVVELADAEGRSIATARSGLADIERGATTLTVALHELADVQLWDVASPTLYDMVVSLESAGEVIHVDGLRTGYREARFETNGFFLNGTRRYVIGVNRHGYFPFAGFAMPDRVQRRDAEIIKHDLNCVMVRCAHYPQTASFLDACDELGLLVWEESPGWQYVGDSDWQDQAADDIEKMIERDRHRPSIVVWGARLNETPDRPDFYARTEALVKSLDATRATSGTLHGAYGHDAIFQHDVLSYDDYNIGRDADGDLRPDLLPPVEGRPYLISEAVATLSSPTTLYNRVQSARVQQHQALDYANAHNDAMGDERYCGLLAWVAFDYQAGMGNHVRGVRVSGLGDVFRILKPGAAIFRAQVDPSERIVLEPAFTWDPPEFGHSNAYSGHAEDRTWGPGEKAMICSNCDRLEVFVGDDHVAVAHPDRERFPHLTHAPSFVDLTLENRVSTDLRIDGYLWEELVVTRRYSGDRTGDSLRLLPDDVSLVADGVDATRVVLMVVDRFGEPRGSSHAVVKLKITGPGSLVGDNPFDLDDTGAVGAVWVRTVAGEPGSIVLRAFTPELGMQAVEVSSVPAPPGRSV
jgi:beta-galactosidase